MLIYRKRLTRDHRAMQLLFGVFCFLYAYFFQGGGWNQNSHFDTVRAIVERHAFDITSEAANTGDVAIREGKVYSNKGPGLALWAAPAYFVLYQLERSAGSSVAANVNLNAKILTFYTSGLPGVLLVLVLYRQFRRRNATSAEGLCLAGAFGAGSLLFPYAGVMMSQVLTACLLFTSWHIISGFPARPSRLFLAGVMTGMCVIIDLLAGPAALLFLFYVLRRHPPRASLEFLVGAGVMALGLLAYNQLAFGSIFITNQTLEAKQFQTQGLLLGMLAAPELIRLYWLSFHPFRGLFYCCPVLLLSLLSWSWPGMVRLCKLERSVPAMVIASFVLFNVSFNGWTGGWGVGPRYLIPALPFLFSFALAGFRRWPTSARLLMVVSTVVMFSVTAVQLMVPAPNGGRPSPSNPIVDSVRQLWRGQVSTSTQSMLDYVPSHTAQQVWASYNLGELIGLRGLASILPAACSLAFLAATSAMMFRERG
jgi:hypothetical protein